MVEPFSPFVVLVHCAYTPFLFVSLSVRYVIPCQCKRVNGSAVIINKIRFPDNIVLPYFFPVMLRLQILLPGSSEGYNAPPLL